MNTASTVTQHDRRRKMLLVMPLLILPFLTMGFWALGGGKSHTVQTALIDTGQGINARLPAAQFSNENPVDKLRYYEMADADSGKIKRQAKNDAWLQLSNQEDTASLPETRIQQKLQQLGAALETPPVQAASPVQLPAPAINNNHPDTDRLEQMLQSLHEKDTSTDPEMQQINTLLDKIMAIQHPENTWSQQFQDSLPKSIIPLTVNHRDTIEQGFYSVENNDSLLDQHGAIAAMIPDSRVLTDGTILKMRLLMDVTINGLLVPAATDIYGTSSLQGERLLVRVNSIRSGNTLLPVSLSVYDMDGIEGIYAPGALSRDVVKQSTGNNLTAISSLDPSIGMQAASAGIETARQILDKKIKRVSISVKAGYQILLKDNH